MIFAAGFGLTAFSALLDAPLDSGTRFTISASDGFKGGPERMAPIPSKMMTSTTLIATASAIPDARRRSGVSS